MPQGSQDKNHIDTSAFENYFADYEADLYRYARYLTNSSAEADDIYQETWLRLATFMKKGKDIRHVKNFLFTVATNLYKDELRKTKVRRFFLGPSLDENGNEQIWVSSAIQQEENELSDALQKSLNRLSARQRSMFCLFHIEGFTIAEVSKMCKCAEGTVKATIYKAVQKLRQDLKEFRE